MIIKQLLMICNRLLCEPAHLISSEQPADNLLVHDLDDLRGRDHRDIFERRSANSPKTVVGPEQLAACPTFRNYQGR